METSNFSTTILVDNSKEEVFNAINTVRGWWQGEIDGNTENLNDEFDYSVPGIHFSKQKNSRDYSERKNCLAYYRQ